MAEETPKKVPQKVVQDGGTLEGKKIYYLEISDIFKQEDLTLVVSEAELRRIHNVIQESGFGN